MKPVDVILGCATALAVVLVLALALYNAWFDVHCVDLCR